MNAGMKQLELDAQMAQIVGWQFEKPGHGPCCTCQRCGRSYDECDGSCEFSDDIAAAMEVVEALRAKWFAEDPQEAVYWKFIDCCDEGWRVEIVWPHHDGDILMHEGAGHSLPLAICLAAQAWQSEQARWTRERP